MSVSIVFFLKSLDLLEESLAKGRFRRMKATSGFAVVSRDITQKEVDEIHARGQCLGCFHYYEWRDRITHAQMGIFRYDHVDSCENWISGPYARRSVPADPIFVDEVPFGLRRLAYRVRFADVCFLERELIQPVEEFPCTSHQRAYVELNRRFARPMPGDELTYNESYAERVRASVPEEMREDEDLIWLPPKDEWLRRG